MNLINISFGCLTNIDTNGHFWSYHIIEFDADGEEEEDKDEYDGMSGTEPEDGMVSDDEHDEDMPSTSCRVMPSKKKRCKLTSRQTDNIISDDEHDEDMPSTSCRVMPSKKKRCKLTSRQTDNIISDDEHDEEMLSTSSRVTSSKKKRRKLTKKKKWTEKEKRAVRKQFAAKIARKELPGKKEIEQFIKNMKIARTWNNVKDHIRNTYILK